MLPELAVLSFWQDTAQVVIRATSIVLAVLGLAMAAVAAGTVNGINDEWQDIINAFSYTPDLVTNSRVICRWILLLSLAALLYQSLVILLRFINIELTNLKTIIFMAIDIVFCGVFALGYLAGGITVAGLATDWEKWQACMYIDDLREEGEVNDVVKDNELYFDTIYAAMSTTAGDSILAGFVFGAVLLGTFFTAFCWNTKLMKKNTILTT